MTAADEAQVMTYNVRYDAAGDRGKRDWGERLPLLVAEFEKASIVGLQEGLSHQVDQLLEKLPDYVMVGCGRDDGKRAGEFVAIFYDKTKWQRLDSGTFWLSDTPEKPGSSDWGNDIPRHCTWAHLRSKAGEQLYVFNTHFDHRSQKSREKSAKLMIEKIKSRKHLGDPVLLMGDLNAGISNPAIKALAGAVTADKKPLLVDSYLSTNPENKNPATFNKWQADYKGVGKIDFIFHSPEIKTISSEIQNPSANGVVASDHMLQRSVIRWGK